MSVERKENAVRSKFTKNTIIVGSVAKFLERRKSASQQTEEIRQKPKSKSSSNAYVSKYLAPEPTQSKRKASLVNKLVIPDQANPDTLLSAASPKISPKIHISRTTNRRQYLKKKTESGISKRLQLCKTCSYAISLDNLHREQSVPLQEEPRRTSLLQLSLSKRETDSEISDDRASRVSCCSSRSSTSGTSKCSGPDIFDELEMQDYLRLVAAPLTTPENTSDIEKNINIEEDQELHTPYAITDTVSVTSLSSIGQQVKVVTDVQSTASLDIIRAETLPRNEEDMLWYGALRLMAARVMSMLACMLVPMLWMGVAVGVTLVVQVITRPDA